MEGPLQPTDGPMTDGRSSLTNGRPLNQRRTPLKDGQSPESDREPFDRWKIPTLSSKICLMRGSAAMWTVYVAKLLSRG